MAVNCVTDQWFEIKNMTVQSGRLPTLQEYELGTPVVVIGEDVRTHFFPGLDPLGRELRIAGIPYEVIGVAEKQGASSASPPTASSWCRSRRRPTAS